MTGPPPLMKSRSSLGSPQAWSMRMACSITTETFGSPLKTTLLPM